MLDAFRRLARYNRWMNARLYGRAATLPDAERRADRGAFFGSIQGTLNHLLLGDRLWITHWAAQRLLPAVSGYDAEMVRVALTGYLQAFRAPQLHRFVAEDFANPKVLDEFQPAAKGGFVRAYGPGLLVHSWAGNVPALAYLGDAARLFPVQRAAR